MFDETNENVTENTAENTTETTPQNTTETFSPIPEEPAKKSSGKVVVGVVIGVVVAVLLILIGVLAFSGLLSDKKATVLKALEATFTESDDYLKEVYDAGQYDGFLDNKEYTIDAEFDTDYYGLGIDVSMMQKKEAASVQVSADMMGTEIVLNVFADENDIVIELPEMLDYLLTINRTTMADDIQNLVEIGMLDQETADTLVTLNESTDEDAIKEEEALKKLQQETLDALKDFYNKCEMKESDSKELTVNGNAVKCKGYVLVITPQDAADFFENLKKVFQNNEEYVESAIALNQSPSLSSLYYAGSPDYDLDSFYEDLDETVEELRNTEDEPLKVEFYLYDGKVAQIYLEIDEDQYMEWNIEGGNFPLENTSIIFEDEYGDQVVVKRIGSFADEKYQAKYEVVNEYDDSVAIEITYMKNTGDFSMEVLEDSDSLVLMNGNIEKSDKNTVEINLDTFEIDGESAFTGRITITNTCDGIEIPEGTEKELLLMSEDDWNQVLMDIVESLY